MAFLGRLPDPATQSQWVAAFAAGATEAQLVHSLVDSPEYQAAHASDSSFIGSLYVELLGRSVDPTGLSVWQSFLQNGGSRDAVVTALMNSTKFDQKIVDQNYQNLLHRSPSAGEQQVWVAALQSGAISPSTLSQDLLASPEYYAMAVAASQA
jgi:hypothetical protein